MSWLLNVPATGKVYVRDGSGKTVSGTAKTQAADQTCSLTHSQYINTGATRPHSILTLGLLVLTHSILTLGLLVLTVY